MSEIVIVDALRTAIGRRNGALSRMHSGDLLAAVLRRLVDRSGIDALEVGQVVGGCVQQVGMQSANITRTAWLTAGLPLEVPATTVNVQCGSSQQATTIAHGLVAGGIVDVAIACGVENMSSVPLGSSVPREPDVGTARSSSYEERYEITTQFQGADRIASKWGFGRAELEAFGKRSQDLAAQAWEQRRFDEQIVPVEAPVADDEGRIVGTKTFARDECLRETSLDVLAKLRTNLPGDGAYHTAGTSSQISDGAAAVLVMTAERAAALGVRPRARIVDSVLVGSDPILMLTGPIPATRRLLERTGIEPGEIDLFEVNEAFASVVLAWRKELGVELEKVNPNGGAIALGHPLGGTGVFLLTKAVNELERSSGRYGLVTMCCGGGLGTGTLIERT
jgi:acetyl-CoA C-acetyltransferase